MDTSGREVDVINDDVPESISPSGNIMQEMVNVRDILARVELGTAYSNEKSGNLNMLMMHVATKESEYEAFISDEELMLKDSAEKVLYLELLCGILDSEVDELENFMSKLRIEIVVARKFMVSYKDSGEDLEIVEKMLQDSEESLRQSLEQVSDVKEQSSDIQRNLLRTSREDTWKGSKATEQLEDDTISVPRNALKMMDRSLARELDLDKRISDIREVEEDLKLRLHFSEHKNLCMEEEDLVFLGRLFEGENTAEVLMGISKELLGQIQNLIFSLNASKNREKDLSLKLEDSIQELKAKDATLQRLLLADSEAFISREKVSSLETQVKEYELQLMDLKTSREMSESDSMLQRASAEASQEKENMLNSTIKDMENVIENLKSKVLKAENLADSAEDKCIELSECNSVFSEELHLLKGKMDCLTESLHRAEESKKATAKDIRIRTKLITETVMQLALERERLQKQISSLTKQNKILVNQSQQTSKSQVNLSHNMKEDTVVLSPTVTTRNSKSANIDTEEKIEGGPDDCRSDFETVRNIDARQLNLKYVIMMVLVLVISVFAALLFQPPDSGSLWS